MNVLRYWPEITDQDQTDYQCSQQDPDLYNVVYRLEMCLFLVGGGHEILNMFMYYSPFTLMLNLQVALFPAQSNTVYDCLWFPSVKCVPGAFPFSIYTVKHKNIYGYMGCYWTTRAIIKHIPRSISPEYSIACNFYCFGFVVNHTGFEIKH